MATETPHVLTKGWSTYSKFVSHYKLNNQHNQGKSLHRYMASTYMILQNHSNNMEAHKIPQIIAKFSYQICESKEHP